MSDTTKTPLSPPRGFRTDTIGIFLVLWVSGIGAVLNPRPGPLRNVAETSYIADLWQVNLIVFGAVGLLGCLLPRRMAILGRGLELTARLALGFSALAYAIAIYDFRGPAAGTSIIVMLGIAMLMLVGAQQIWRWLRQQRKAVDAIQEIL